MLVHQYPWFYMPVSIHKLSVHGDTVMETLLLPIGMHSEVQESQNKHNREYRLKHARITSRANTMTGQYHRLFVTSDPVITEKCRQLQRPLRRQGRACTPEVDISHLILPAVSPSDDAEELDEIDDDLGDDADFDVNDVEECSEDSENSSEELSVDLPDYCVADA